jgi:hypothetical protein
VAAEQLRAIRQEIDAGRFAVDADTQRAILARVDDMIEALESADRALSRLPQPAVSDAAAKLAYLFYVSGRGWKRYLSDGLKEAAPISELMVATRASAEPILATLTQAFIAHDRLPVTKKSATSYALPCAACGADAVTMTLTKITTTSAEQMVVSSLSPVTVFRPMTGPRMADLIAQLNAGVVEWVIKHLRETQAGGCDAWCEQCDRLYCKAHYAVEAQWSGSWHEATYATCPLGHEHEID